MPTADPLTALLELVRAAARDGTAEALLAHDPPPSRSAAPLLDKKALAHALAVSTATIDRLSRDGRIPYVPVGEVRRFDLDAVRAALQERRQPPVEAQRTAQEQSSGEFAVCDVRLLSRGARE